jgi:TolA protein
MFKVLTLPLLATVFFHGLIVAVILIDMPDSEPLVKTAKRSFIKAELVTLDKPKAKPTPKTKPKTIAKPKPVKKKPAVAKKKPDNKAKLAAKEKAKQQKLAKAQAKKKKEEQARAERERIERERQIKEETERELEDAIAAEDVEQQADSDEAIVGSYIALISSVIVDNWSRPPSARNNMEALLSLQLVPTGEVVNVSVIKSSGNAAFDRSAEQAVRRAQRFPELQKLPIRVFEKNFRRLRLKFRPEDLRL